MKISARNVLGGKVEGIERGQVTALVKVNVGGDQHITASITMDALNDMGLQIGDDVMAVVKASNVILATM